MFSINPHSDLFSRIVSTKYYEPELVKLCIRYLDKNRDVIDVGANIGFFTVLFAKNVEEKKKVVSIEPTKNGIKLLRRNIELNDVAEKVEVFEGAASNMNGFVIIETIEGKEEYSSLGNIKHPGLENEKFSNDEVVCVTLDALVKEKKLNPGFIKVDVEGSENLVFQGAHDILRTKRPIILSEVSELYLSKSGSSAKEVIEIIMSYDYDVFDANNPSFRFGLNSNYFSDISNIICFPKEMKVQI